MNATETAVKLFENASANPAKYYTIILGIDDPDFEPFKQSGKGLVIVDADCKIPVDSFPSVFESAMIAAGFKQVVITQALNYSRKNVMRVLACTHGRFVTHSGGGNLISVDHISDL